MIWKFKGLKEDWGIGYVPCKFFFTGDKKNIFMLLVIQI